VAFSSSANNLVVGDTNGVGDIFVHDRQTGETKRVSVSSTGGEGNSWSTYPSISGDGRYVTFNSTSSNLVVGDTNSAGDVFVHDLQTGETTRVSKSSTGVEGNNWSNYPTISADGRYVAFISPATNIVSNDTNGIAGRDVFVHDLQTGETTRVSISSTGIEGNSWSNSPKISGDGRYVVFHSDSSNLVTNDTNGTADVFIHDRQTGETKITSVSSSGAQGNLGSYYPAISSDGHYVAFQSEASNLVDDDTNGMEDIFIHDTQTGQTKRTSLSNSNIQGNSGSRNPAISADGSSVAFWSLANNLIDNDTNGVGDIFVRR